MCPVCPSDIREEDSPRHPVSDDVVTETQQPVIVIADAGEPHPQQWSGLEIERLHGVAAQNHVDGRIGILRSIELYRWNLDLPGRTHDLERAPIALHEGRVQDLLRGDGVLDRCPQCVRVQRTADAHLTGHRVAGRSLGRTAGLPDPLLSEGAGDRPRPRDPIEFRCLR